MDAEKRLYLDRYHVTMDGSVTMAIKTGAGPEGRHLVPSMAGHGSIAYFIRQRQGENARTRTIRQIVKEAFGIDRRFTVEDFHRLHDRAMAVNAKVVNTPKKQAVKRIRPERARAQIPTASSCPFPGMTTWCSEFTSWDCPEMDPLSCGSWSVPLDMTETAQRRKAA